MSRIISGVYFVKVISDSYTETLKVIKNQKTLMFNGVKRIYLHFNGGFFC